MYFDKCRQAMKDTITMMNVSADHRDKYKNREEYGKLQVFVLFLQDMGHEIDGSIITDEDGLTSCEGIYAGGDAVTGAATVILAMGAGKKAAAAMDRYIQNKQ